MTEQEEFEFRLRYEQEAQTPAMAQPTAPQPKSDRNAFQNFSAGAVRGAGSIGATLLYPFDKARDLYYGDRNTGPSRNESRREDMTRALGDALGFDTDSTAFGVGKLTGEIAGTSGVGGVLANGVRALAPSVTTMQGLARLNSIARGLESGGFSVGAAGMPTRMATGAASGAATVGLANPSDMATGAAIGGVLPPVLGGVGRIMESAGRAARGSKAPVNSQLANTVHDAVGAGYVIPPNMVNPSFTNQVVESVAGKQATQQVASTKNARVTEGLVRQALGIADDVPLSQGTLENLRRTAGKTYAEVSSISPQAAADLEALKVARNEAQGWFKAYNRSARPDDLAKAKEARALSEALEKALEDHASAAGLDGLIPALREARKQIAKTYTVGRALNDAAGTVDARVFGRMHEKGLPLSDGLDVAGRFASAFPTVAKSPQQIGSPAAHNLKSIASMAFGGAGAAAMGPGGLLVGALPFVAPPAARSVMFSKPVQQGLLSIPSAADDSLGLLTQAAYRGLPLLSVQ